MNNIISHSLHSRQLSFFEELVSLFLRLIPIKYGKHRILDKILPKVWNNSGNNIIICYQNRKIVIEPHDLVGWHFAMLRSFDPEVTEILAKACNSDSKEVFWDIGANKGACFCSLASKLPYLKVVAIEPQSSLAKNNLFNLESICPGRYEYVQTGLGEKETELTLIIPDNNLGKASLHVNEVGPNDNSEVIKIQTAKQISDNSKFGWPTIAKIDVEGHEPQVFQSLKPCLAAKLCKVIVFENHIHETKAFDFIESLVRSYGYNIYGIKKTPWSTRLIATRKQLLNVTDYAVINNDLIKENKKLAKLIS